MKSVLPFRWTIVLAAILVTGVMSASPAAAQIYIMESTAATIRVGSTLDMSAAISMPAGRSPCACSTGCRPMTMS